MASGIKKNRDKNNSTLQQGKQRSQSAGEPGVTTEGTMSHPESQIEGVRSHDIQPKTFRTALLEGKSKWGDPTQGKKRLKVLTASPTGFPFKTKDLGREERAIKRKGLHLGPRKTKRERASGGARRA